MKIKALAVLLGLLVVTTFGAVLMVGCDSGGGGFSSLTELIRMAPYDVEMVLFVDFKKIMSDPDFEELYEEMKESFESSIGSASDRDIINFDDIHYIGLVMVDYEEIILINGDFNLDIIRESLEDEDFDKDSYGGVEIWYGYSGAVAIHDGALILGDDEGVVKSVEALVNPDKSAYEKNKDIRDVTDELSSGLFSMVTAEAYYPGADAAGMTISKLNSELIKFSGCIIFGNSEDAEDSLRNIELDMESEDFYHLKVSRSGNFVKFSAEIDIEESGIFW
ncbi:MAG TPA: hypothetical protein G4O16_00040 [Dehalococcoidia bacterium]|nr:hypothetical protein [Dehalococcoidia bacterium]